MHISYGEKGITSLKKTYEDTTEFIWNGKTFGEVDFFCRFMDNDEPFSNKQAVCLNTRREKLTEGYAYTILYALSDKTVIKVQYSFRKNDNKLYYTYNLQNLSAKKLIIEDLSISFPMNADFSWEANTGERVLCHQHIAGKNSFLFWTRCNGKGPYLLCIPGKESSMEFFHLDRNNEDKSFQNRVYFHAWHHEKIADQKGCKWRQPVTRAFLRPHATLTKTLLFTWADGYDDIRLQIYENGLADIQIVPGMVLPLNLKAKVAVRSKKEFVLKAEFPEKTELVLLGNNGEYRIYEVKFHRLGENRIFLENEKGYWSQMEFFITEPLETCIKKRGSFLAVCQHKEPLKWYNGLISEWNMESCVLLGPDNYDRIKGWRIYEVSCDDPGLCKPAFLALKNCIHPVQAEVAAVDYYIDNFVWGGLQRTDEEEYAYGIYGIPDWKTNRHSTDPSPKGRLHLWRIYDYPHIAVIYYAMYKISETYPNIRTNQSPQEYLLKAYRTMLAMFTIPDELIGWSALKTGLYNEKVILDIVEALYNNNLCEQADRLKRWWEKKVTLFVSGDANIFGSEYPFDTTGFESTHAFARYAIDNGILTDKAEIFMHSQINSNIACRGWLETEYYLLGSDLRGNCAEYTLSYMSQMAGGAIVDYALHESPDKFAHLRLGYASLLSSWALLNSGTADSDYGYWYPGASNDGAAAGGFEPSPYGETWLEQPHHRGAWYYACEIDLGYCGYLREARTILAQDPLFGWFCYGGEFYQTDTFHIIRMMDGIGKHLNIVTESQNFGLVLKSGRISNTKPVIVKKDLSLLEFTIEKQEIRIIIFKIYGIQKTVKVKINIKEEICVERLVNTKEGCVAISWNKTLVF